MTAPTPAGPPTPEIGYNEDEATGVYTRTQGTLNERRQGLPDHDASGISDPAITGALRDHNDKTRGNIADTEDTLGKGKKAVGALGDADKGSEARARAIDPGGVDALKRALSRPTGPASPLSAPAAMPAAMPAPMPTMPVAPPMPQMAPGMVNVAPDALARLIAGADLSGSPAAGEPSSDGGPRGGKEPISVGNIDFRQTGNGEPLTKSQIHAIIEKALDNNGISRDPEVRARWHDIMYNQAMKESSGVIDAVNKGDINAVGPRQADGAPQNCSRGLWQVTAETFSRHHVGGTSMAIYDPEANASASVAYQIAKDADRGNDIRSGAGLVSYHSRRAGAGYGAY